MMATAAATGRAPSDERVGTNTPTRRLKPRIWDTDWLVLRKLGVSLSRIAAATGGPGATVIDLGCGSSPYKDLWAATGARYIGADLDARADLPIDAAGRTTAPGSSADLLLSVQVLEHVRDLDAYLAEAKRLLSPSGRLVLSTHGTWLYHAHPEDHRRWTRTGLILDLEQRGFAVEKCEAMIGPLGWTTMMRLTGYTYALRSLPVLGKCASAILATLMNAKAWLEDAATPRSITADNACVYLVEAVHADA